jgi:hypothetical protein
MTADVLVLLCNASSGGSRGRIRREAAMFAWTVSLAVTAWPTDTWTAHLVEHFPNHTMTSADRGLDLIERWSVAGRAGHLPVTPDGGPVTVHGRLGLTVAEPPFGKVFGNVLTWTPWQAPDNFETPNELAPARPLGRDWADSEVARFLADPLGFVPDDSRSGTAEGVFNKLERYVGRRKHGAGIHNLLDSFAQDLTGSEATGRISRWAKLQDVMRP